MTISSSPRIALIVVTLSQAAQLMWDLSHVDLHRAHKVGCIIAAKYGRIGNRLRRQQNESSQECLSF